MIQTSYTHSSVRGGGCDATEIHSQNKVHTRDFAALSWQIFLSVNQQ